jgi:hypothetical protein
MKTLSCFAAALILACLSAKAGPPFNPKAALDWCVDTVVSPVPVGKRIYVLGPDKTKEVYVLDGTTAYHELETRLAVECVEGMTLAKVFRALPKYAGDCFVKVWRVSSDPTPEGGIEPLYSAPISQAAASEMVLRPNDIVEIQRPSPDPQIVL